MKLTKCANKHFYDADKFGACPHCGEIAGSTHEKPGQSVSAKPSTGSPPISSKKNTLSPHTGSIWDQDADRKTASFMDEFNPADGVPAQTGLDVDSNQRAPLFCGTCGAKRRENTAFCGKCGAKSKQTTDDTSQPLEKQLEVPSPIPQNEPDVEPVGATAEVAQECEELPADVPTAQSASEEEPISESSPKPTDVSTTPDPEAASQESLRSQVNAVASHGPTEDLKTMAFYNFTDVEPVVGWLVCVIGEYLGQSFNLKTGQNFIGRALTMDVPLAKDTSVSRDKHATVTYDPQNRVFYIQPGESSGLTYLNGNLLLAHQPLKAYEKIKVGNSEFVFIPCCGDQFTWEDYMQ